MKFRYLIVLTMLLTTMSYITVSADEDIVIPPDPNAGEYEWYVASDGVFSPTIYENIQGGIIVNSPVADLEGGSAWGQASLYSTGLYVEGKGRTGLTSGIHLYYNSCASVLWLNRDGKQIASNPTLNCKYTTGVDEVSRIASDAWEVFPAVYSTRTRHYITGGDNFTWDENDEVSS